MKHLEHFQRQFARATHVMALSLITVTAEHRPQFWRPRTGAYYLEVLGNFGNLQLCYLMSDLHDFFSGILSLAQET